MTRDEQILKTGEEITSNPFELEGFIEGVEWADRHPKDDPLEGILIHGNNDAYRLGYKKAIDKAHVWLMENYDKYVRVIGSSIYFAYFELGRDFRKAMEDEL